jgi:hypothetical protein
MDGVDLMGPPKKYAPEEIVAKLRQVEIMIAQGQAMADAIRAIGVSEQSSQTSFSKGRCSPRFGRRRS